MSDLVDKYSETYSDIMVIGDFNEEPMSNHMKPFMDSHQFKNLIKSNTCFKKDSGKCIDLIVTNKPKSFQFSNVYETGCSDHHLLIYTMMKLKFKKLPPQKIIYRNYSKFNSNDFVNDIERKIPQDENNLTRLNGNLEDIMNKHAPLKTKFIRENNQAHVSKELRKEIMTRSRLKNKYNKSKSEEDLNVCKRQRNHIVSLNRKQKKLFFKNLSFQKRNNSKDFWKYCKPYFSNKATLFEEKITLFENDISVLSLIHI